LRPATIFSLATSLAVQATYAACDNERGKEHFTTFGGTT
jgi:hypothetical protein